MSQQNEKLRTVWHDHPGFDQNMFTESKFNLENSGGIGETQRIASIISSHFSNDLGVCIHWMN